MAVRSSSCSWVIRPVSTAIDSESWKDGIDSLAENAILARSMPSGPYPAYGPPGHSFLVLGSGHIAQTAGYSPDLLVQGWVARVGLADDRRQLQQRLGEDVLPYLAPEGWVPFQRINDVLEGGDRRGHFLVTSF